MNETNRSAWETSLDLGIRLLLAAAVVAAVDAGAALAQAPGKKHPRLASAQGARCATCHAELLDGKKVVHAATEDCTACHVIESGASGATVKLAAPDPELCVSCHADLADAAEGKGKSPHAAVQGGCLSCHLPHAGNLPKLLSGKQAEVCGACHDVAAIAGKHGGLLTPGTTCTACHLPHGGGEAKLLKGAVKHAPFADATCNACHRPSSGDRVRLQARGARLCLACHDDPAAAGAKSGSVHPALADDRSPKASCLGCHEPHLSASPRLLVRQGPELCASCHGSIVSAAKAKTGHAAARESCGGCHVPHASPLPRLLKGTPSGLCLGCHANRDGKLSAKHLGADLAKTECLRCHSPHGAGNPKLLAAHVHPPVLEGCEPCHQGSAAKLAENGGSALCTACHSGVEEAAKKAAVPHAAMEGGSCTPCHEPHASAKPSLSKPAASGCGSCHTDQLPAEGESAHRIIELVGCEACHEPHGGSRKKMLRAEGAALCLECHQATGKNPAGELVAFGKIRFPASAISPRALLVLSDGETRNHPASEHRTLGTPTAKELARVKSSYTGELTCLTCHDPHKGRSRSLFRWGASTPAEACQHCHDK